MDDQAMVRMVMVVVDSRQYAVERLCMAILRGKFAPLARR
jgi:hypothetical protein